MTQPKHPATRYRSERIVSVVDGAKCYLGWATSITLPGAKHDTIVMGKTKDELRAACKAINPSFQVIEELLYQVVILQQKHATLDDEL